MKQVSYELLFTFIGFIVGLGAWWVIFHGWGLFGGLLGAFIGAAIGNSLKKRSVATKG